MNAIHAMTEKYGGGFFLAGLGILLFTALGVGVWLVALTTV
jgi:hypothetical protein